MTVKDPKSIRFGPTLQWLQGITQLLSGLYEISDDATPVPLLAEGAGRLFHLETNTVTSAVGSVDFEVGFDGTYKRLVFFGDGVVPDTDAVSLIGRVSVGGTYQSGASDYDSSDVGMPSDQTADTVQSSGQTGDHFRLHAGGTTIGSASGEASSFMLVLSNPAGTSNYKGIYGWCAFRGWATNTQIYTFGAHYVGATSALDGLRFLFGTGNIESGVIESYGLRGAS